MISITINYFFLLIAYAMSVVTNLSQLVGCLKMSKVLAANIMPPHKLHGGQTFLQLI